MNKSLHAPAFSGGTLAKPKLYWLAQIGFWTLFTCINIGQTLVYTRLQPIVVIVPLALCALLFLLSHGIRTFYKALKQGRRGARAVPHLLWVIPLAALAAQSILFIFLTALKVSLPALAEGMLPYSVSRFISYVANSIFLLSVWTSFYLAAVYIRDSRALEGAYWHSQAQLREAELQFLRSQINSHFVFNAMNNLRALIRENPELARDRLTQLANLLRAVLQSDANELIPLGEELKLVEAYLALESLQYENRLQVKIEIDESMRDYQVPPMLIQSLVENAVRHGIASTSQGGCIDITAKCEGERLLITITNPRSSGTEPRSPGDQALAGHGIGLSNARKRLRSIFGDKAKLELKLLADSASAELVIPSL